MKFLFWKQIVIVLSLATACGTAAAATPAQEQRGPRIEINQERYDFGNVKQGDEAVHVFEFKNSGDDVLIIQRVQTS